MATVRWVGKAQSTAQLDTITISAYDAATTYSVTINGKVVSVAGVTSTSATASALATALQASEEPEFTEITFAAASSTVTCTANTAGTPFTMTVGASGGTGTMSTTTTTANSSPNDLNNAKNWSGGSLPTNADDVVFDAGEVDVKWNLSSLSGVTLTSLTRRVGYTGKIGLPEYNQDGSFSPHCRNNFVLTLLITLSYRRQLDQGTVKKRSDVSYRAILSAPVA
jgi:hypothetical protein